MARTRRRARAIIGGVVVLGLAAAAGTVFALDYHQARSNAQQKKVTTAKQKAASGVQVIGVVTAVDESSVTLRMPNGKPRRLITSGLTTVVKAAPGSDTDVRLKKRGLLRMKAGTPGVAQEVLVLPLTTKIGLPIVKVGFGFVWLRTKDGRLAPKVNVSGATVEIVTPAPRTDIESGEKVVVHAQGTVTKPVRFFATDIVLLPSSSTFVG